MPIMPCQTIGQKFLIEEAPISGTDQTNRTAILIRVQYLHVYMAPPNSFDSEIESLPAKSLFFFRTIDAVQANLNLPVSRRENSEGIAIRHMNNTARES